MLRLFSYISYASAVVWLLLVATGALPTWYGVAGIVGGLLAGVLLSAIGNIREDTRRIRAQLADDLPPISNDTEVTP